MKIQNLFIIILLISFGLVACQQKTTPTVEKKSVEEVKKEPRIEFGINLDSFRIDTCVVNSGETLGGMLAKLGASQEKINSIATIPTDQFDVRNIRSGNTYYALFQKDSTGKEKLEYYIYKANLLETIVLHLADSVHVEKQEKEIVSRNRSAQVAIQSSLWATMTDNNLPVDIALELSDIYDCTIDFFELQKGDSIRIYFEERCVDSVSIGVGRIYAVNFYHGKKWRNAYWFEFGNTRDYYDEDGNGMKKAFLKAPLSYKRISSGFTHKRLHPVHKVYRPHTGVDYAAPMGTPVVTIGDGVVIQREYRGGGGNTVKIKHNDTYTTAYLHLSKFAEGLKVGQHVKQGQLIGYVGSTGTSTGPHLDFRIWKNGTPIDPLKMDAPTANPIPAQYKDSFNVKISEYKSHLLN
ncbi:MAG: M23 family metallopeptidase [Paludibacteraceae bacterium]|nr:M23 family metallopeptidase [Paludibacteraceae bacterium]